MSTSPTPAERLAMKTANAALLNSPNAMCDIVATVVFALGSAQLLQSPETAAELNQLRDDVTGACLARWEEEQALARAQHAARLARQRAAKLRARVAELEAAAEKAAGFCAQRAEYVDALRNCAASNTQDYYRWTGHAEARRQLSGLLALPVAWPAEDPHDSPLHRDYRKCRDLPEVTA